MKETCKYEEMTPQMLKQRIENCPVGYIPLGTLEWHSWHLPIGTDLIESRELFNIVAEEIGGVVFPPLFLGPDITKEENGVTYYGMEVFGTMGATKPYPLQKLPGSCYWVPDQIFKGIIDSIALSAQRNGFKILVGTGHCPSSDLFASMANEIKEKYNITLLTPDMGNPEISFVPDHAAKVETSTIMHLSPSLVHMENLSDNPEDYPLAISGDDPRYSANADFGKTNLEYVVKHLEKLIKKELSML